MDQPKIKNLLIRKLYAVAKRQGMPMTVCLNKMLEEYLVGEEPIPYAARIVRVDMDSRIRQHELQHCRKFRKEHYGGAHETKSIPPQDSPDAHLR
jgi:hypothetical protein